MQISPSPSHTYNPWTTKHLQNKAQTVAVRLCTARLPSASSAFPAVPLTPHHSAGAPEHTALPPTARALPVRARPGSPQVFEPSSARKPPLVSPRQGLGGPPG